VPCIYTNQDIKTPTQLFQQEYDMGLLDGVLGSVLGSAMGGGNDPKAALIQGVLGMLMNNNQGGGAGMLGNVLGSVMGGQGGAGGMLGNVLGSVMGGGQGQGGGLAGGLGGLLGAMTQNGMGDHAASWQGNGANMPIDSNQLTQILGSLGGGSGADILGKLAGSAGLSSDEAAGHLSDILPNLVDKLTPNGQPHDGNGLDLGSLMQSVLGK
jgi:uncharacterized protein YidB (DUF937 family)